MSTQRVHPYDPRGVRGLPTAGRRIVERWLNGCASRTCEVFADLKIKATIAYQSISSHTATEALTALPDPDVSACFAVGAGGFTAVMSFPPQALLALLHGMIGVEQTEWPAPKPLSTVEQSLAEMLFDRMRREWSDAWPQRDPVAIAYKRIVNRTARSRVFDPGLILLTAEFTIETPCGTETLRWMAGLDNVELLANPDLPPPGLKAAGPGKVADVAPLVPMPLSVELGRAQLSVMEADSLKCGDVLVLDQMVRGPLVARVAGLPKYQGRPGRVGSRLCFAIESLLED